MVSIMSKEERNWLVHNEFLQCSIRFNKQHEHKLLFMYLVLAHAISCTVSEAQDPHLSLSRPSYRSHCCFRILLIQKSALACDTLYAMQMRMKKVTCSLDGFSF